MDKDRKSEQANIEHTVSEDLMQIKLNMADQQSVAHNTGESRGSLDTRNARRNFSSAKVRMHNRESPQPESYHVDETFHSNKNHPQNGTQVASDEAQHVQRDRIQNAVKKTRDVFGNSMPDQHVSVAKYIIGKNQRQRNASKTRLVVPTDLPKGTGGGNAPLTKSRTREVSLSPEQMQQQRNPMYRLQSKTVITTPAGKASPGQKQSFQQAQQKKQFQSVATILSKARAQASQSPTGKPAATTSLSRLQSRDASPHAIKMADLDGVISPGLRNGSHNRGSLAKTFGKSSQQKRNSEAKKMKMMRSEPILDIEQLRQSNKDFKSKSGMEQILDKFFPSEQQLEQQYLQRMLDGQAENKRNINENVFQTEIVNHEEQLTSENNRGRETPEPWILTAETAMDEQSFKQIDPDNTLRQAPARYDTSATASIENTMSMPQISKEAMRLNSIFNLQMNEKKQTKQTKLSKPATSKGNANKINQDQTPKEVQIIITQATSRNKPPVGHRPPFRLKESSTAVELVAKPVQQRHATPQNLRSASQGGQLNREAGMNIMKQFGFFQGGSDNKIVTDGSLQDVQTLDHGMNDQQIIQAKKLAHIINQAQQQKLKQPEDLKVPQARLSKSVSVPNALRKELKEAAAAMFAQPEGVLTDIGPKEFLQKIDTELRRENLRKLEQIKDAHRDEFEQLEQCGIVSVVPAPRSSSEQRLPNRLNTPFSKNVRSTNFFNIFVNNSVDTKIDLEKNASQTSSSLAIENVNRDDKEMALMHSSGVSFNSHIKTLQKAKMLQQQKMLQASINDRKDEKLQGSTPPTGAGHQALGGEPCKCNSLTNEMIHALMLDSPIKDLIEAVHTYQFFHQIHKPGKQLGRKSDEKGGAAGHKKVEDPLKKALDSQIAASGGSYSVNERTDVAVLNILLNQILTGKYTFDKSQIFKGPGGEPIEKDATGRPDWSKALDRFLRGINFKEMLSEIQKKILKTQEGVLEVYDESEDEEDDKKDFFFLNTIKQKEMALAELLETRKLPDKNKQFIPGEAATFLTQVFKDSELTQKELEEKFPNWAKARSIMKVSQDMINSHAASAENVAHQKRLRDKKLKKEKEVKHLFDKIHNIAQDAQKTAIGFFQDQTLLPPAEQADNAGKEQLLYLCFLEIVRQVSGQCKEQAIFLVKLWHAYFDHFQHQMRHTLTKIGSQTNKISDLLETMTRKFSKVLLIDESKDLEFLALIDKHEKALQLLELVSKSLYQEREQTNLLKLELDTIKDNFKDILPHYEKYYRNKEFRQRLMKYSILEQTDAWSPSERQQLHMTPVIRKLMEEQMERDPKQAPIIKDIYRIQSVCTIKMPVEYALENAKEAFQKSAVALKMKEVYYKNLQERAQRLKRQNEGYIKRIQDQQEHHKVQMIQKEFEAKERINHSVKVFRQQQLKNILSDPKEVQTDHELLERYFADLENQKELGVRAMMISKKLTNVQMQQLRVMKAFEKTPKYKHFTKPIFKIMRDVRNDESKLPAKTLKKTLEIVAEIIQERLNLMNAPTDNFRIDLLNLEHFYAKFMQTKYGIDSLAMKYTEQWLVSIKAHAHRDPRINLFMRFLGLGGYHSLPFSVFRYYLHLLKSTNVKVEEVFANADPSEITLSYQKVMKGYRSLIEKTNIFNRRNIMTQLRHNSKINANNPIILRELSFSMFETYRYLVDRVIKSQKYRSFSELLNQLFEQHSYYHENEAKRGMLRKKRLRKNKSNIMSMRQQTTDYDQADSFDLDNNDKSQDESKILTEYSSPNQKQRLDTSNLNVVQENMDRELSDLLDTETKKYDHKEKNEEDETNDPKFEIRAADQAEEEKDFIKLSSMIKFIANELGMTRKQDILRLKDLFEVILIKAQYANPDRIGRFQALRCFTEKIEIAIPMDVYFDVGINAEIDHENSENMWLEKVFNFYSQLVPDNYKASSGMDPDHRLVFSGEHAYDGLEFVQFYIFVKDGGSKMGRDKIKIYQIYEDELQQKNRQRLSCDDFIELIRKFNLIKSKIAFENNMRMRYEQAKNREVHLDTQERGTQLSYNNQSMQQSFTTQLTPQRSSRIMLTDFQSKAVETPVKSQGLSIDFQADASEKRSIEAGSRVQDQSVPQNRDVLSASNKNKNVGFNLIQTEGNTPEKYNDKMEGDSFDEHFQNTESVFQTKSKDQSYSFVNLVTQQNSRLSVLSRLKKGEQKAKTQTNANAKLEAQAYVMVQNDDGMVVMSPQPHTGPTMLEYQNNAVEKTTQIDMMASSGSFGKQYEAQNQSLSWPQPQNQNTQQNQQRFGDSMQQTQQSDAKQQTQTTFARPPSPIEASPNESHIVDKIVIDTITTLSQIQSQKAPVYATTKAAAAFSTLKSGQSENVTPKSSVWFDQDSEEEKDPNDLLIEAAVSKIQWSEQNDTLKFPKEDVVLSRADTFQAHAISEIDLLSYKLKNINATIPELENEVREQTDSRASEEQSDKKSSQNEQKTEMGSSRGERLEADPSHTTEEVQIEVSTSGQESSDRPIDQVKILIETNDSETMNLDEFQSSSLINSNTRKMLKSMSVQKYFGGLSTIQGNDRKHKQKKRDIAELKSFNQVSKIALDNVKSPLKRQSKEQRKLTRDARESGISEWGNKRSDTSMSNSGTINIAPNQDEDEGSDVEVATEREDDENQDLTEGAASRYQEVESKRAKSTWRSRSNNQLDESKSSKVKIKKIVKKKKKKAKMQTSQTNFRSTMDKRIATNDDIEGVMEPGQQQQQHQPSDLEEKLSSLSADEIEERKDKDKGLDIDSSYLININVQGLPKKRDQNISGARKQTVPSSKPNQNSKRNRSKSKSHSNVAELVNSPPGKITRVHSVVQGTAENQDGSNPNHGVAGDAEPLFEMKLHILKPENQTNSPASVDWDKDQKQSAAEEQKQSQESPDNSQVQSLQNFNYGNALPPAPPPTKAQIREQKKKKLRELAEKQLEEQQQKKWEEAKRNALFAKRTYADEDDWIFGQGDQHNQDDQDPASGAYLP